MTAPGVGVPGGHGWMEKAGGAPTFWFCRANQNEITDKRTCQSDPTPTPSPSPKVKDEVKVAAAAAAAEPVEAHFVTQMNRRKSFWPKSKRKSKQRNTEASKSRAAGKQAPRPWLKQDQLW